jgi:hypothetical protein
VKELKTKQIDKKKKDMKKGVSKSRSLAQV